MKGDSLNKSTEKKDDERKTSDKNNHREEVNEELSTEKPIDSEKNIKNELKGIEIEEYPNYLNKLLLNGHTITNPSYKNFSEISLQRFHALLVNILAISSTMQREKIIKKLRDYAADFKAVSM